MGGFDTSGHAHDVEVLGNLAYVGDGIAGLEILDVSDPAAVTDLGGYDTQGFAYDVQVVETSPTWPTAIYGLQILDVSNPAAVTRLGGYDTSAYSYDVHVVGNVAYVADDYGGLVILDVSDPAAVTQLGGHYAGRNGVQVVGDLAYVVGGYDGLHVLDVSHPEGITRLGGFETLCEAEGVHVVDGLAYVAHYEGLEILDVSNPAVVTQAGQYETPDTALDVQVVGNLAYVVDDTEGLLILDVSDPAAVTRLNPYGTSSSLHTVHVAGDLAYLTDGAGVQIVDVSNPASPNSLGKFDTPGFAYHVQVVGDLAYVADYGAGIQILDVSNPDAVIPLGGFDTPGSARRVQVVGDLAYVADYTEGVQILDVSDPTAVTHLGEFNTSGFWAYDVQVVGDLAYAADYTGELLVMDVSNPAQVTLLGQYYSMDNAHAVKVLGSVAYVADSLSGLAIFEVGSPAANISHVAGNTYRVDLGGMLPEGEYALLLGPDILDAGGTAMDQDQDGTPREASDDVFFARFGVEFFEYGNAPDGPYPTLLAGNGARHTATGPTLGANRDAEADGQPTANADGDDTTGTPDDEDGVTFGSTILVGNLGERDGQRPEAPSGARLDAWIDFNADNAWDGTEKIADSVAVTEGDNAISFGVPRWAQEGATYARFRLSSSGGLSPTGEATDGEVEDYAIAIGAANTPPVAVCDTYSTPEGTTLTVPAAPNGLLANDADADGDSLTAARVDPPLRGSVTVNGDGSFQYTPIAGFRGIDQFTYKVNDSQFDSNVPGIVRIRVEPSLLVQDINENTDDSEIQYLAEMNGKLFFVASDGPYGAELRVSDGTAEGTMIVKDIVSGSGGSNPGYLTNVNGTLYSAPTTASTARNSGRATARRRNRDGQGHLRRQQRLASLPSDERERDALFRANDGTSGPELWKSDGTPERHRDGQGYPGRQQRLVSYLSDERERDAVLHCRRRDQRLRSSGRATAPRRAP